MVRGTNFMGNFKTQGEFFFLIFCLFVLPNGGCLEYAAKGSDGSRNNSNV